MPFKLDNSAFARSSTKLTRLSIPHGNDLPPIAAALAKLLRSGELSALERTARIAVRQAASDGYSAHDAVQLLLAAASAARALGDLFLAEMWMGQAGIRMLSCSSVQLFAEVKREETRLLLDQNQLREALTLSAQIDCTVIERGKDTPPLITRVEKEVTIDTFLLQAELALIVGAIEQAAKHLQAASVIAAASVLTDTESVTSGQHRHLEAEIAADRLDYYKLLQAIYECRRGEQERGAAMLAALCARLEFDESSNQMLLARCQAASGIWVEVDEQPPVGINIFEARRWQTLSRPASETPVYLAEAAPKAPDEPTTSLQHAATVPASPVFVPDQLMPAFIAHLHETAISVASDISARFAEQLERVVEATSRTPARARGVYEGYVCGGKFPFTNLPAVIAEAEAGRVTGYILVDWNPALLETTILSKRLSPLARCGIGWVWLHEGSIIDATLCAENPPPAEAGLSEAAITALTCLLQIGLGVGLDHDSEGQAFCYPDDRARSRHARISLPSYKDASQNFIMALVSNRETELGFGCANPDIIGSWENN